MKKTVLLGLTFSVLSLAYFVTSPIILSVASASTSNRVAEQEEFNWRGSLAAGKVIAIEGVNGFVYAEPTAGKDVEVRAIKSGKESHFDKVDIQVLEQNDGVIIKAVYPRRNNTDVRVDFTVKVPAGVRFSGQTVNGDVKANELTGHVNAATVNGSIKISTTGYAEATTVNGSITASFGDANWDGKLEFHTVNGSVTLTMPNGLSTEFSAECVNGDISTDFPINVQGRIRRHSLRGTIGSGGRELDIETVNGSIQLRRAA
jgi:hypothetical protein